MASEAEHHPFCQLASADSVNTTHFLVRKHILDHAEHSLEIWGCVDEVLTPILDKIVKRWEHVFKIKFSTSLEGSVDKLEGLPHGCRN
jgi:hypothetical protein